MGPGTSYQPGKFHNRYKRIIEGKMDSPGTLKKSPISCRMSAKALSLLPHSVIRQAARIGGFIHYLSAHEKRNNLISNTSFIDSSKKGGLNHIIVFQNHALNVLEMIKALSEDRSSIIDRVSFSGLNHVDAALKKGKGLLLTTCHLGNWELAGAAMALRGYKITTVAGKQLNSKWSPVVKEWKKQAGIKIVSKGSSFRTLYRDLQENRIVVLHIDGNIFSSGLKVDFLGKKLFFPRGPGRIARFTQAPTAFAYCKRKEKYSLEVFISEPINAPENEQEEIRTNLFLIKKLEKCILDVPEQWCIFRKM